MTATNQGKYFLDAKPQYSMVPVIGLRPGHRGTVHHVSIYNKPYPYSAIFTGPCDLISRQPDNPLADATDEELTDISRIHGLPFDELAEIRVLEQGFRNSHGTNS